MKSISIASLAYASGVAAFWRMPCRYQTGIGRIDPLVDPGTISDHVHTITGGGAFGPTTDFKALTAQGSCTACDVKQDHSAYWTPTLHFQYDNGTTVMVPQVGGMLAYYLYYLDNVKAFPEGFAMIAGNPSYRNFSGPFPDAPLSSWPTDPTDQFFLQQRALGFNCLNYAKAPEGSLYRHQFPEKSWMDANCVDGLRLELAFPSCGKEGVLDSEDHRSHVAYPSLVKEGNCPSGFDVHYPFLFFETIWATNDFAGESGQFVLSTGDPVGPSYHGDFIMGWESADFLQSALDTCQNPSGQIQDCALFDIDSTSAAECTFTMPEDLKNDDCHGPREGLPVDVPIQKGPEPATKYPVAGKTGVPTTSMPQPSAPAGHSHEGSFHSAPKYEGSSGAENVVPAEASKDANNYYTPSSSPAAAITEAPVYSAPADDAVYTTYITKGNEVIELVVEEKNVTVTATPSAASHQPAAYQHKRHLEKHQHHHHRR